MKILLVEDHLQYVPFIARDLHETYGHEVIHAANPLLAREQLQTNTFDVAIADLSYDDTIVSFKKRQAERATPSLTGGMIHSGLSVVRDARDLADIPTVIWTSAEPNRRLHIIFAHSELNVRAFCSKSSLNGTAELHRGVLAATSGMKHIDPTIELYLPPPRSATLNSTILSTPESKRAMWRALALGASTKEHFSALVGIGEDSARNQIGDMYTDLCTFDSGFTPVGRFRSRTKITALARFAEANYEFFLDDAVQALYP